MNSTIQISQIPTEVLQTFIFKYLDDIDIWSLGQAGDTRLKEIAEQYLDMLEVSVGNNYTINLTVIFDILCNILSIYVVLMHKLIQL